MKTGLLTLAALGWAASAMAGDWKRPTVDFNPEGIEPTSGETVYLYNTVAGQFLTNGNAWNTQSSFSDKGLDFLLEESEIDKPDNPDEEKLKGWSLKNLSAKNKDNKDASNKYLYQIDASYSYVDLGSLGLNTLWQFAANGDGTYKMTVIAECNFFAEGKWFGFTSTDPTVVHTDVDPADELYADGKEAAGIYWKILTKEQYEAQYDDYKAALKVYEAKLALYDMLNRAEEAGISTDEALGVYNNANTIEEIEAATSKLNAAITKATIGDRFDGATLEEPVDASFLIGNPKFEEKGSNWTSTFTGKQETVHDNQDNIYTNGDGTSQLYPYFMENWVAAPKTLADYDCHQKLAALPAGAYALELDVMAIQQGAATEEIKGTNLYIIINGDTTKVACSCHLTGQVPTRYNLPFVITEDGTDVTIGIETQQTNANWVAFDNWGLLYKGNAASPELLTLKLKVDKCKVLAKDVTNEDGSYYLFSAATATKFDELIADADKMDMTTGTAEVVDMTAKLTAMYELVEAEKQAYEKLQALWPTVTQGADSYADVPEVGDALGKMDTDIEDGLGDGTLTLEDVNAILAEYNRLINEVLPQNIVEGTTLTVMLKNPNFENNSRDGWTVTNDPSRNMDGKWTNVAAECAEMWNKNFEVYQDLTNLPEGLYEVGLQGFVRQGTFQGAFDNYCQGVEDIRGFVFGTTGLASGELTTKRTAFKSVFEGKDTKPHFVGDKLAGEGFEKTDISHIKIPAGGEDAKITDPNTQEEFYIPNGMTGFALWEEMGDHRFQTTAKVFVTDGTLRIGAISDDHKDFDFWCIFDSFTLTYVSHDMLDALLEVLSDDINALKEQRDKILAAQALPADICSAIEALTDKLGSIEMKKEAIDAMSAEVALLKSQLEVIADEVKKQTELYGYLRDVIEEVESSDPESYSGKMDELFDNYNAGETVGELWETTEEMRAEGEWMKTGWIKFVTADATKKASLDTPFDVSEALINRGFEIAGNTTDFGWKGNEGAAHNSEYEFFNKNFNMYQMLEGMPEGYYELEVQGFYRPSDFVKELKADSVYQKNAMLYATVGETTWKSPIMTIYDGAAHESAATTYIDNQVKATMTVGEETIEYYFPNRMDCAQEFFNIEHEDAEGNTITGYYRGNKVQFQVLAGQSVQVGVKKDSLLKNDWTLFDDFQLRYLGTEAPTAVEGVVAKGTVTKQAYYTIGGLKLARPQRGVNIVVTTLPDGTTTTAKVVVK